MSHVKDYPGIQAEAPQLLNELNRFFKENDYEVHTRHETSDVVIQAHKSSAIRDWVGTSYALTVRFASDGGGTRVVIGKQKWIHKAIVGGTALFLLISRIECLTIIALPFLITAAIGAYKQYKITEEAWNVVENHVGRVSAGNIPARTSCHQCGANNVGGRFCHQCGAEYI